LFLQVQTTPWVICLWFFSIKRENVSGLVTSWPNYSKRVQQMQLQ